MQDLTLCQFIDEHRDELVRRCREKVARRSAPPPTEAELTHGIPLFLDQLCEELRHGPSKTHEITTTAKKHGHDLLIQGFTISQVVHDYGDVCQSITDLAMELAAPIKTDEFRTLNRCLDDAIAGAVTEFAHEQDLTRDGESYELRRLIISALSAFEVLQTGNVGVGGSTGAVILRALQAMGELVNRESAVASPVSGTKSDD